MNVFPPSRVRMGVAATVVARRVRGARSFILSVWTERELKRKRGKERGV